MLQKIINKFLIQKTRNVFGLQRIVTDGNALLNSALSWTFSSLGFNSNGLESLDKNTATLEPARLVQSACADFNGSSSKISIPLADSFIQNDFSIAFCISKNDKGVNDYDRLIDITIDTNNTLQIITDDSGKFAIKLTRVGVATVNRLTYGNFSFNTPTHIAVVLSGSTCTFYRDGVVVPTDGSVSIGTSSSANKYIGTRADGNPATFFDGCMWDVRFFDSALSIEDILDGTDSLLNYPLQKSTYDVSGNDNHGTPTDVAWGTQDSFHRNITEGFDKYTDDATGLIEILVPYVDGVPVVSSIANYTKQSSHPAGTWHNGAETKFIVGATTYDTGDSAWNVSPLVQAADTEHILHSASTGYGIPIAYGDLVAEQGNYLYYNVQTDYQHKDLLLFASPIPCGECSVNIHKFVENGSHLSTDINGDQMYDINGYPIWDNGE